MEVLKRWFLKESLTFRSWQVLILIAHLVLLRWILFTLSEGGVMDFYAIMAHFTGISLFGALLIRFSAYIYRREYLRKNG